MADQNDTTQEAIPETVDEALEEAPGYVGTLTDDEQRLLASLRQTSAQVVQKIGQHEVMKQQLFGQLGEVEARANRIITEATSRFGHSEPGTWNVTPEGKVYKV